LTQNPIIKVLSVLHGCRVRFLLMGGQACILYGGSEFSRDTDIALLPEQGNLNNLETALAQLKAERIAVPELSLEYLRKGHAVHFRCKHPDALNMRIDIMSVLHNASSFDTLWELNFRGEIFENSQYGKMPLSLQKMYILRLKHYRQPNTQSQKPKT